MMIPKPIPGHVPLGRGCRHLRRLAAGGVRCAIERRRAGGSRLVRPRLVADASGVVCRDYLPAANPIGNQVPYGGIPLESRGFGSKCCRGCCFSGGTRR